MKLNIKENAETFINQKEAKAVGQKPPRGRYHMVNTALKFKKGVSKKGNDFAILIIYARSLALVKTDLKSEKEAKLAVQGNGGRQFEIFWNLESDYCKRDLSWWLIACGLDPETEEFDAGNNDVLAKAMLHTPYEIAFDVKQNGKWESVEVMELKKLDAKLVKKYKNDPDFEKMARVNEDHWYETQDLTALKKQAENIESGEEISQDDLDDRFGSDW